jgi:hypothetical protein
MSTFKKWVEVVQALFNSTVPFVHMYVPNVDQGCQMVCFQTKNPNWGKFWRVLQWKMMLYFMDTWSIFTVFCYMYFMDIWYSSW